VIAKTPPTLVRIDAEQIIDWGSFHNLFSSAFGFPDFYGRNMNAWVDCMTDLDDVDAAMTSVHAQPGGVVTLVLEHAKDFAMRCPELYATLVECAAFVNWRRIERGYSPVLAMAFWK
jgi:RNAse (barnase) inhibitor barstar